MAWDAEWAARVPEALEAFAIVEEDMRQKEPESEVARAVLQYEIVTRCLHEVATPIVAFIAGLPAPKHSVFPDSSPIFDVKRRLETLEVFLTRLLEIGFGVTMCVEREDSQEFCTIKTTMRVPKTATVRPNTTVRMHFDLIKYELSDWDLTLISCRETLRGFLAFLTQEAREDYIKEAESMREEEEE